MKALIVEPSRFFASVLSAMLLRHQIESDIVTTGEAGLNALGSNSYDLMCFAYALGDMNGKEFFLQAKVKSLANYFPSFMITSGVERQDIQMALSLGVTDCVLKNELGQLETAIAAIASQAGKTLHGRVLLVEDSDVIAAHSQSILTGLGLQVDRCKDANDALKLLRRRQYDLLITDFMLEGEQTGLWLVRRLRESAIANQNIPVLAISGFEEPTRKIEILRAGANDFVAKPVLDEELILRVSNLLNTRMLLARLEKQYEYMRALALHDQLTGLYNRHYLEQRMANFLAGCDQKKQGVGLIALDIDHFKHINDQHGHATGDRVLEAIAQVISDSGRNGAIAARLGGEEFMLLQPDIHLVRAAMRAEGIRHRIESLRPADIHVTASMGVVVRQPGESFEHMLQRADRLVYACKGKGRNQIMAG